MKEVYDNFKKFMEKRFKDKQARGDSGHYAAHCDSRVLHIKSDCQYCAHSEFDDLHEYRKQNKILYTGEAPRSGWWPCPAEHERGLKSVNSWGGNTPKPDGCTCSYWYDPEKPCSVHPPK